ncbi:unnamed protein product [Chrysoparadoxa australica]
MGQGFVTEKIPLPTDVSTEVLGDRGDERVLSYRLVMMMRHPNKLFLIFPVGPFHTERELQEAFLYAQPSLIWRPYEEAVTWVTRQKQKIQSPEVLLQYLFPLAHSMKHYTQEMLIRDTIAGLTLATLMIPQGMAFATVAGIPLVYGLYIVWIPSFMYALYGDSIHVSYGPYALIGIVMSDALGRYGHKSCDGICKQETPEVKAYLASCCLVTFMVGLLYFAFAVLRFGDLLAMMLAEPVVDGFVQASALLVMASQLGSFFQIPGASPNTFFNSVANVWERRSQINVATVIVGVASIVVYRALKRANQSFRYRGSSFFIPEALFVVVVATCASYVFDLHGRFGIDTVGPIPRGLPPFSVPDFSGGLEHLSHMAQVSVMTAVISFIVTHSIATQLASSTKALSASKQLIAFGAANLVGSFFLSLPCAGSLSRAAILKQLRARTNFHGVVTFVTMTLVLLYFSPLLEYLPSTVLSATIFAVITKFLDPSVPQRLAHTSFVDLALFLVTFGAVVWLSVIEGITVGLCMSFMALLRLSVSPLVMELGRLPGTNVFRDQSRYPQAEDIEGVVVLRFGSSLHFANKEFFRRTLQKAIKKRHKGSGMLATDSVESATGSSLTSSSPPPPAAKTSDAVEAAQASPSGWGSESSPGGSSRGGNATGGSSKVCFVVLDASGMHGIDSSAIRMLEGLVTEFMGRTPPIEILMAPVSDPLLEKLAHSPLLMSTIGERCYLSIHSAAEYAEKCIHSHQSVLQHHLKTSLPLLMMIRAFLPSLAWNNRVMTTKLLHPRVRGRCSWEGLSHECKVLLLSSRKSSQARSIGRVLLFCCVHCRFSFYC